jgi:hypothetical protein
MNTTPKDIIIKSIMEEVNALDIAWYLKWEVWGLLKYLHYYKLKNFFLNKDALIDYLYLLDNQNTTQIHTLQYDSTRSNLIDDHEISYFVSNKWLEKIWEYKVHQKIFDNDYNLNYIMQGIKWLLLLTADEFCNASPTRMSINRMLWQKQLVK